MARFGALRTKRATHRQSERCPFHARSRAWLRGQCKPGLALARLEGWGHRRRGRGRAGSRAVGRADGARAGALWSQVRPLTMSVNAGKSRLALRMRRACVSVSRFIGQRRPPDRCAAHAGRTRKAFLQSVATQRTNRVPQTSAMSSRDVHAPTQRQIII